MSRARALMLALLAGAALSAFAPSATRAENPLQLALPQGAAVSASRDAAASSLEFPTGPWQPGGGPTRHLEGNRSDTAWRLRANQATTLQILAPLRDQIEAAGYGVLFECETEGCGGFDFRFALNILPEPEMHVDLADFRYLAARRGNSWLGLVVSRSSESGFVHLSTMLAEEITLAEPRNELAAPPGATASAPPSPGTPTGTALPPLSGAAPAQIGAQLEAAGSVALDDLVFESGRADLGGGEFASLKALAAYLQAEPGATVVLVGHTDAMGSLAGNIALSQRRAEAVRKRLVDYGAPSAQLSAEGAGWLAPRASNLTDAGREKNRRVEAILTSTQSWRQPTE
jgi:OOP family OmpA-OmpF porin